MKKVKLNDLGRGVHFFLENFIEDKKVEFMILRHFPECAQQDATEGYTLVEAAEDLCQAPFDKGGCNDWREASLRKWLNGGYLDKLLAARTASLRKYLHEDYLPELLESFPELKYGAVTFLRDLTADDGLKDYGTCVDTVSLLTAEEYKANRDIYMDPPGTWRWLITPDSTPSGGGAAFARLVSSGGSLNNCGACHGGGGVRPVLYLKSDLLVSVEGVDEDKDELTPEQKETALYEAAVEKFGKHPQMLQSIEEMCELILALLKVIRSDNFGNGNRDAILKNVAEERADVGIMLNQLEVIFGENSEAEAEKLDHLADLVGLPRLDFPRKEDNE